MNKSFKTEIIDRVKVGIQAITARYKRHYPLFLLLIMTVQVFPQTGKGINNEPDRVNKTTISWYATIPDNSVKNSGNLVKRLGNLLFGEDPPLLLRPVAVAASDISDIWIADQGKGEIVFAGESNKHLSPYFNPREERLASITGICILPGNRILFTDSGNNNLYIKAGNNNYRFLNDSLELIQPTGVAVSNITGEIWVIETKAHCITVLNNAGVKLRTIGKRGTGKGEFNFPTHIWIDRSGRAYVTDALNYRIQVFDQFGEFIFSFGEQGDATGYFARPKGVATDSKGNIYVADALFNSIQVFDKTGRFLHYFGKQGAGREEFWMPGGLFIDNKDFLYIADSYNSRIQVFKIANR